MMSIWEMLKKVMKIFPPYSIIGIVIVLETSARFAINSV